MAGARKPPFLSSRTRVSCQSFEPGFASRNLVRVAPPYAMHMGGVHVPSIVVNKIAAGSLARVLLRITQLCGHSPSAITDNHCDCFSGSFVPRNIRGDTRISMHAVGLAVDFDAPRNPLGAHEEATFFKPNSPIVKAFKEEGWIWGGDWRSRRDAMHFQAAIVG